MLKRKGIVLAGGTGSRLFPLTLSVSKQLLPIFDKPLIYYPLSVLILAGIQEVLFITTPDSAESFRNLLGDGSRFGMSFEYAVQTEPRGLADAYKIGRKFLNGSPSVLILGDNIFFGHDFQTHLARAYARKGASIFASLVKDPERFGVVQVDERGKALSVVEKPSKPLSRWAITGLYFMDERAPDFAVDVKPSARGEIEIVSILERYLAEDELSTEMLHRGFAWLDAGTHESLHQASDFVKTLQDRQGLLVCSPEEIAYRMKLISLDQLSRLASDLKQSSYGQSLQAIVQQETGSHHG